MVSGVLAFILFIFCCWFLFIEFFPSDARDTVKTSGMDDLARKVAPVGVHSSVVLLHMPV